MNAQTDRLRVVLFEDQAFAQLGPIELTRPAFEIREGVFNLRERLELSGQLDLVGVEIRSELEPLLRISFPELAGVAETVDVRLNARLSGSVEAIEAAVLAMEPGEQWSYEGRVVAERVGGTKHPREIPSTVRLITTPWQLVHDNMTRLSEDFETCRLRGSLQRRIFGVEFEADSARAHLLSAHDWTPASELEGQQASTWIRPESVLVGPGATVRPGAVIDAENGPVILGAGCVIHPLAVVTGPAFIGAGTVVNAGAKLREGCSIGAHCKVGGEIEEVIMHDLSNKQHDGFLGHALLGSWVNLGADTNGSDLKNNYGSVRVDLGDGALDTGESFVGPQFGDHAKTGINTMLVTGCVVGVAANVFGAGFGPRHFPSFSWGGAEGLVAYRLDAAIDTAKTVFGRRGAKWTTAHEDLLQRAHELTAPRRDRDCGV